jgi:type I restriction enzyme S subunit
MPRANWQVLSKSEWVIPNSLETQQKIAGILSAYDDLIENNNKRIKILEEMAQMLYKEWFVDFKFPNHQNTKFVDSEFGKIPEGWEVVDLDKKIDIRKGKNITKNTVKDGNIPVVAGGLSPAYYHNEFNTEAPVITVSASGANAGYVNLYHSNIWASDCSFIDKKTTPFVCFYYLFLKNKQIEITGLQRGSAQPHVYPKDLMGLKIFNIPNSLISGFEEKILPIFLLLKNLDQKNTHLKQTRDLLLPRLISGELSVENLQVKYNERTQH